MVNVITKKINQNSFTQILSVILSIPHGLELPVPSETFETISNHDNSIDSNDYSYNDKDFN